MALGAAQDDARELGEIDTVHVCQGGGGGALGYKGIGPCVCAPRRRTEQIESIDRGLATKLPARAHKMTAFTSPLEK